MSKWLETIAAVTAPGAARKDSEAHAWAQYARHIAAALRDGTAPPEISVFGPVLSQGEVAFFQGSANYERRYGGAGSYTTTGLVALGSPAFMLTAFAASAMVNHRRKARAHNEAVVRWREHQRVGLIATSRRLMINASNQEWSSYDYEAITEYYPDIKSNIESSSLTIGFGGRSAPMLLAGPPVPAVSVLVAAATMPDKWTLDPRLRSLLVPPTQR